jgi:hypothetical protein
MLLNDSIFLPELFWNYIFVANKVELISVIIDKGGGKFG